MNNCFHFVNNRNPVNNNESVVKFSAIIPSSKAETFDYVDVRNNGLYAKRAPNECRTRFLDSIVNEVNKLIKQHGDEPRETRIQMQCKAMQ